MDFSELPFSKSRLAQSRVDLLNAFIKDPVNELLRNRKEEADLIHQFNLSGLGTSLPGAHHECPDYLGISNIFGPKGVTKLGGTTPKFQKDMKTSSNPLESLLRDPYSLPNDSDINVEEVDAHEESDENSFRSAAWNWTKPSRLFSDWSCFWKDGKLRPPNPIFRRTFPPATSVNVPQFMKPLFNRGVVPQSDSCDTDLQTDNVTTHDTQNSEQDNYSDVESTQDFSVLTAVETLSDTVLRGIVNDDPGFRASMEDLLKINSLSKSEQTESSNRTGSDFSELQTADTNNEIKTTISSTAFDHKKISDYVLEELREYGKY